MFVVAYPNKSSSQSFRAFAEAWDWLVKEGLLIRNHQQPAKWYLISRKGEEVLQDEDRQDRGEE
jgi:predicted transcriptional regulator